jgi:hypothetical protein
MEEEVVDYEVEGIGTSDIFIDDEDFIIMKNYRHSDVEKAPEPSNCLKGKSFSLGSHLPIFEIFCGGGG